MSQVHATPSICAILFGSGSVSNLNDALVLRPNQPDAETWSSWIDRFDDATVYQTLPYGTERYGRDAIRQLIVQGESGPTAVCQLIVKQTPLLGLGYAHAPWGPVWRTGGREIDPQLAGRMLRALVEEFVVKRGLLLRLRFNVVAGTEGAATVARVARSLGFLPLRTPDYPSYRLNLNPPLEGIRAGLKSNWRKHLNKAERQDLEIDSGTAMELIDRFEPLYAEMLARKQFGQHVGDVGLIRRVQQRQPEHHKFRVFICRHDGEDVAGIIVGKLGDSGMNEISATTGVCRERKLAAAHLLRWRVIEWLKSENARYYELRGAQIESLRVFKEGVGGDLIHYVGSWEHAGARSSAAFVHAAEKAETSLLKVRQFTNRMVRSRTSD